MTIAYAIALAFALSYGIATAMSHRASHVLLPLLDIFQSVPVLGYLPIVFAIFLGTGSEANPVGLQVATIILIFTAMAWSPTFGVIAGINAIPADIKEASRAYGLNGVRYLRQIVLPAVYPELIWTSILAWGSGWYLIPIEEYVPFRGSPISAGGLGSYIAQASRNSDIASALFGLIILVGIIYAIDQLVWRPLGVKAEKYKYESTAAPRTTATPRSGVSEGVRKAEDRIVAPVRTFYKSQRSIVTRALEVVRVTKLLHATERLKFPERISRIPFWGRLLSYAIFLGLVAFGLELLIAPRSESILNALTVLAANVTAFQLIGLTLFSLSRLVTAYLIALGWTLAAGILIARSQRLSRWLVPIFDIGQSIPATALFPLVVIILVDPFRNTPYLGVTLNFASIILLLTGMQWYLLFNIVGAVNSVPNDINEATKAYRVSGGRYVKQILVPAAFPAILIGSIQAWGGGWNALIVSEYIDPSANVPGLGSFLVEASNLSNVLLSSVEIFAALLAMTATVLAINRLVWRRLLRKADRYKFEA
jgi:NitT/TauT family transport system permease protein